MKLLNAGIHDDLPEYQHRYVKNANIAAVVLAFTGAILAVVCFLHTPESTPFALAFLAPAALTILLNYFHITLLSRLTASVLPFLVVALFIGLINGSERHLSSYSLFTLFAFFLLPWALFDTREKIPLIISTSLLVVLFMLFPVIAGVFQGAHAPAVFQQPAANISQFLVGLLVVLCILFDIHRKNKSAEKTYELSLQELQSKEEELEKQEKKLQNTFDEISLAHKEDDKRSWISKGVNQLNNVLRNTADKNLYQTVITTIVKYLGVSQGGIYEISENNYSEKCLALKASYGYDWNKAGKTSVTVAEAGLLGDAYHEKAPIYTVEVPEDYTYVESGLGKTKPKAIFTVPLIYENSVEGMLELASLKDLQEHERELILRIAAILARFIESYQVNQQSQELLEKTNQQTEEMRAQEEEMRQNMEELQATQEELSRKEQEYISRIEELESRLGK